MNPSAAIVENELVVGRFDIDIVPPAWLYRIQDSRSFTLYKPEDGFKARGQYLQKYEQWITPRLFHEHLDWNHRGPGITPLISCYDNERECL